MYKYFRWDGVEGYAVVELAPYKGQLVMEGGEAVPELSGIIAADSDAEVVIYFRSSGSFTPAVLWGENPSPQEWVEDRDLNRVEVHEWAGRQRIAVHQLEPQLARQVFNRFQNEVWNTAIEFQNHDDYDDYDD